MKIRKGIQLGALLSMVILSSSDMYGQQDPQYTHYMYNTTNINPGYSGTRGVLNVFGMYRTQWVGLDGAPQTANISIDTPLGDNGLSGGINYTNDRIGAMSENNFSVNLAYAVDLNDDFKLSFGLKGTANLLSVDYTKLDIYDPNDPTFGENISNKFNPNVGAGLFLYSDKAYVGVSVPNLLTTDRTTGEEGFELMRQKMHFYLTGGYVFDLNPSLKFKPAVLVKTVSGAPIQVDLTANFLIVDRFTVGAAYRWDASVSGLVGFQVNDGLFIGYSYDADTSKLSKYNSGSHEVFLRFDLFNKYNKVSTARFF
ncbi:type IX secretion system membrane protein PorP/SprF [Myroides marinus]|uniref:PorP/SprF family type IX secretion system membrane protein n=3 Tax=Myroides marinus TaxID=703342 RepID=UPI002578EB60|nr:type IX secretion system membrane protein PorP/SprF [Myroides marinus]MDM1346814.1 type IX secretion system membrane protein PorP/SprF [Myroides marinus]MDM1352412.1 type IX secretion system membrane protein PorP/SprF [Myroides marinus]MDM1359611.1 type IX secretion system membrane protein PorP/SprF [Myroides marinus]MDM1366722.1 type IX secretion system membrane protein PorP/SprF [Myroides marinus]MDM1368690.1 type IX secretion system membrane protein PorP/SprF [Myroides marinus]